jgi:hypothetical protein
MDEFFKYGTIVDRCRLKETTARYAAANGLGGRIPEGGKQGRHREFSLEEAMWLALNTHLIMGGASLSQAMWMAVETFNSVRRDVPLINHAFSFYGTTTPNEPWIVEIIEHSWFRCFRNIRTTEPALYRKINDAGVPRTLRGPRIRIDRINLTTMEILLRMKE